MDNAGKHQTKTSYDVVIVGSGMGGATLAYALRDCGASVLLIERGDFLPQEEQNWNADAVFAGHRYQNASEWYDVHGKAFSPGNYYYVGGNTKLYGASLVRFRREDFQATEHEEGISPQWPFQYEDLESYYLRAEQIFRVHGNQFDNPTLKRSQPFPYPEIGHDSSVQEVADALSAERVHPVVPSARHRPAGRRRLHPLRHLRRVSLQAARKVRRRCLLRPPRARVRFG